MKERIISIGILNTLSFVDEYAKNHNMEHINVNNAYTPEEIFQVVLSEEYQYIYINLKQVDDVADEIAFLFKRLVEAANGKIIVGATNYLPASELVQAVKNTGIKYFIFSDILIEQKEEFQKCMKDLGNSDISSVPDIPSLHEEPEETISLPIMTPTTDRMTIAILSKTPRMGTTTIALQICQYLKMMSYKVCYIQMNKTGWVQLFEKWTDGIIHDEEIGRVVYKDIDMYYKPEKINSILNMGYNYYIYDYGTTDDTVSVLEKNIQIGILGTAPLEMENAQNLINSFITSEMIYCFNFVPETERQDVLNLMENKSSHSFFFNYCPNPFFLSAENTEILSNIFKIEKSEKQAPPTHSKRKRLFTREKE